MFSHPLCSSFDKQCSTVLSYSFRPQKSTLSALLLLATLMAKVVAMKKKKKKAATHFFKIILPGYLNELPFPPKFARNLKVQNHRAATIRDPLGRAWQADVEGEGEDLWFCGEGWMDFVKGLDIGIGYFLLFKYKGNMNFHVKVFDLTACEVEYSHEICYRKRFELSSALNKQAEAKASKTAEKLFKQFCKSLGPHFSITLKFCNLRSTPYLNVPLGFLASNRFENKNKVILIDPKGRSSPVRITIRKRRPVIQCCFGMGWHEFCLRNHLSAGDKCIFEIKSEEADAYIVHVHIIRE